MKYYISDGSLDYKITFKYDDRGKIIESNNYNSDGSLKYKYTRKYDDKDNLIELNRYNSDGSLKYTNTYIYEFDKISNGIKKTIYDEKGNAKEITERVIEYY